MEGEQPQPQQSGQPPPLPLGPGDGQGLPSDEQRAEARHVAKIVTAFREYEAHSTGHVHHVARSLAILGPRELERLPAASRPEAKLAAMRSALAANARMLDAMTCDHLSPQEIEMERQDRVYMRETGYEQCQLQSTDFDMGKVRSTLRQFAREWSAEGAAERRESFDPLLSELEARLPLAEQAKPPRVLVPGAGLGRLAYEVARRGYVAEGNEWSYFMLLGSNFILNRPADAPSAPHLPTHNP